MDILCELREKFKNLSKFTQDTLSIHYFRLSHQSRLFSLDYSPVEIAVDVVARSEEDSFALLGTGCAISGEALGVKDRSVKTKLLKVASSVLKDVPISGYHVKRKGY